jgi:hypothetical protein
LEIQTWLNEVSEACALSLSNYQLLLSLTDYQEHNNSHDVRRGGSSAGQRADSSADGIGSSLIIPTRLNARPVLKCGHLLKLDGSPRQQRQNRQQQQWKLVYLVLSDALSYYESDSTFESGGSPRGVCKLDAYCVIKHDVNVNAASDQHEFTVMQCRSSQSVTFRAMSKEEMECWCQLLLMYPDCV